jgi:hypothetical protein
VHGSSNGLTWEQTFLERTCNSNPQLINALTQVCLEIEIMDKRESYMFVKREEIPSDIRIMAGRYYNLKDAPRLSECIKLPTKEFAAEAINFNRKINTMLTNRAALETDRADGFKEAITDNEKLYKLWDAVRDARCEFYYVTVRRLAMKKIIDAIGEENFDLGKLPLPAPEYLFQEEK